MPTPQALVQYPFTGGMDETESALLADHPKLAYLENAVFTRDGSLRKRNGFDKFAGPGGGKVLDRLVSVRDELLGITTDGGVYSWSESAPNNPKWFLRGQVSPCVSYRDPIAGYSSAIEQADIAFAAPTTMGSANKGFLVLAYCAPSATGTRGIYLTVVDTTDGSSVAHDIPVSGTADNAVYPRLVAVDNYVVIAYAITTGTPRLVYRVLDVNSLTFAMTAEATVATSVSTAVWDICRCTLPGPDPRGVAWAYKASAGSFITIGSIRVATGVSGPGATIPIAAVTPTAITCTSSPASTVYVAYSEGTQFRAVLFDTVTSGVGADRLLFPSNHTVARMGAVYVSATDVCVVASFAPAVGANGQHTQTMTWFTYPASGVPSAVAGTWLAQLTSKPFLWQGHVYAQVLDRASDASLQRQALLFDLTSAGAVVVSSFAQRVSSDATVASGTNALVNSVPSPSTGKFVSLVYIAGITGQASVELVTHDFVYPFTHATAVLGDGVYIAGGVPAYYDGARCAEIGYHQYPEPVTVSMAGSSGSLSAGTYKWRILYMYRDARGAVDRSYYGEVTATAAANDRATLTIPYLHQSAKQDPDPLNLQRPPYVTVAVYRTKVNTDTAYERDLTTMNKVFASTFTFVDGTADAQLGKAWIYTTGEVGNFSPPSLLWLHTHKNRLWAIGDDRRTIWFSKPYAIGTTPGFNDTFRFPIVETGLPLTCLSSQDDYLVAFSSDAIYVLYGDGNSASGTAFNLQVERINSDVGCTNPRSLLQTPVGILFESRRGLCCLTRQREVKYIGQPVADTWASAPPCMAAVLDSAQSQALFAMCDDNNDGLALVYDYLFDRWAVFKILGLGFRGAAYHRGARVLGADDLYREHAGLYRDDRGWIPIIAKTHWFKPAGPMGFSRIGKVGILAERLGNHALNLRLYRDYQSTFMRTKTWGDAQISSWENEQVLLAVSPRQEVQSLAMHIQDVPDGDGNDAGPALTAVLLETAQEPGAYRVPPAQAA